MNFSIQFLSGGKKDNLKGDWIANSEVKALTAFPEDQVQLLSPT